MFGGYSSGTDVNEVNVNRHSGLSPHEILMGRPMQVPVAAPLALKQMDIHVMDETMINFCVALTKVVN